jgi:hypothetical protein
VVLAVAAWNGHRATKVAHALARERLQHASLAKAQNENGRLRAAQLTAEEQRQLEGEHLRAQELRARLVALQRSGTTGPEPGDNGGAPAAEWRYSGNATPKETMISILWAASRGDIDNLAGLIGFAPDVRARVEALFESLPPQARREYGTPEKVVATLISGTFPKDASGAAFADAAEDAAEASIDMRVSRADGQSRSNEYRLDHAAAGWRLLVPVEVVAGYEKILQGEAPASETVQP